MPSFRDKAEFRGAVAIAATAKAIRVRLDDGRTEWIPQSQIDDDSDIWRDGDEGTLVVSQWIAEQKRLV